MSVQAIDRLLPNAGSTQGGTLVEVHGVGLERATSILFGGYAARIYSVSTDGTRIDVQLPEHVAGMVDVCAVDAAGKVFATLSPGFTYRRANLTQESDLTRTVRALLVSLKRVVLPNTTTTVSVDYQGDALDGLGTTRIAELPSLVLSGPRIEPDPVRSGMAGREEVVDTQNGGRIVEYAPAYAVSLGFTITGAARTTVELLNLVASVAEYLTRTRWLYVDKGTEDGTRARLEMDPDGELRTHVDGADDVRAFTCSLVIRGFDLSDAEPRERVPFPIDIKLETRTVSGGTPK